MDKNKILEILEHIKDGNLKPEEALEKLSLYPCEELDFATPDHHRAIRQGFPEVVLCQGKSVEQASEIIIRLSSKCPQFLATRASKEIYDRVVILNPELKFSEISGAIYLDKDWTDRGRGFIAVITAGTSDIPVAEEACITAHVMGNRLQRFYDVGVAGIHRVLSKIDMIRKAAVIVVVAGMEGALPGVVGGMVDKPIIAVPAGTGYGASFHGISALLGMLNSCVAGVTVVNIDNGFGAGYAAALINRRYPEDTEKNE